VTLESSRSGGNGPPSPARSCNDAAVPLLPGAEPFTFPGGAIGVLLCHGFTGTPHSLRPWGECLAAAGLAVSCPRLPGHGTRWQEANLTTWEDWYAEVERAFQALRADCDAVFLMGLSMGATLALRLAEEHGADVAGLVLVNPSLTSERPEVRLLPVLSRLRGSAKAIGNDVKKPGVQELAYDRTPLKAAYEMSKMWRVVRADLGKVHQPLLVFRSREDHVVEPVSTRLLLDRVSSEDVDERILEDSYHVATLDNDAPAIFSGSLAFVRDHAPAATGG
jgi:carboxylesterase